MKTAVVGSGAWGTALAVQLCKNGHQVTMWTFETELIDEMITTRRNPRLPEAVPQTGDLGIKLKDVKEGRVTLDTFAAQLSLEELEAISRGGYVMNHHL